MTHPWTDDIRALRIGDIEIDLRLRQLHADDAVVELQPRVFDLLIVFASEPHVLHTRESLFRRVWHGVVVEDANLTQSIWLLRRALGEGRKHWVRTVSKTGYLFEPPEIVAVGDGVRPPAASPVDAGTGAPASSPAVADPETTTAAIASASRVAVAESDAARGAHVVEGVRSGVRRVGSGRAGGVRWLFALALCAVVGVGLAALAGWRGEGDAVAPRAGAAAPVPVTTVGLILLDADKRDAASVRAGLVLKDWVGFRLGAQPDIMLLSEADLAGDTPLASQTTVILSTGRVAGGKRDLFLRATYSPAGEAGRDGRERRIERRGPEERLPEMIASVASELMAGLAPQHGTQPEPAFRLGAALQAHAEGLQAIERQDWSGAAEALGRAMHLSPDAGIVRLRLAQVLAVQGDLPAMGEQLANARRMLQPISADSARLLDLALAESAASSSADYAEIAEHYAALVRRYPGRIDFLLMQARLRGSAGASRDTLRLLSGIDWKRQPLAFRIEAGLLRCRATLELAHPEEAERCASSVLELTGPAGAGWTLARGRALMLQAMARHRRFPDRPDRALYQTALREFEAGGHQADARFARYRLSMIDNGASIKTLPELQAMLTYARRDGVRGIEFMLSMDMAGKSLENNRFADHRRYLEQARSVAVLSGDTWALHAVEYALLVEDSRRGDSDAFERRIVGLQSPGASNDYVVSLAAMTAIQRLEQGRPAAARLALQRATATVIEHDRALPPTSMAGFFNYVRAHIAMHEGRVVEAEEALAAFRREMPEDVQSTIANTEASLALIRGDRPAARRAIDAALASLAGIQDAPTVSEGRLGVAFLLTRAGDPAQAERLYRQVLPSARAAGYGQWEAFAELGLAEVAAARGDWSTARHHMRQAARLPQIRVWSNSARLALLELGNAIASGDRAAASARAQALQAAAIRTGDHFTLSALHGLAAAAPADFGLRPPVLALPPYRGEAAWLVEAVRTADRRAIASR